MKNKDKLPALNQANELSLAVNKTESAIAQKVIKYCLYQLSEKWEDNKLFTSKYREIDLFQPENWGQVDWKDFTCEFSASKFCTDLEMTYGGKTRSVIRKAIQHAIKEYIELPNASGLIEWYPWFIKAFFEPAKKEKEIMMMFNPAILSIALEKKNFYSHLELRVLGKLKSVYAIRYYELLMSRYNMKGKSKYNNNPGEWKTDILTIEFLKEYFQIKDSSYAKRTDNFISRVVKLPLENLKEELKIANIDVSYEIVKEGRSIKGIIIVGKDLIPVPKIEKNMSKETKEDIEADTKQKIDILKMKEKYPKEFQEAMEEASQQGILNFGNIRMEMLDEYDAFKILIDKGYKID